MNDLCGVGWGRWCKNGAVAAISMNPLLPMDSGTASPQWLFKSVNGHPVFQTHRMESTLSRRCDLRSSNVRFRQQQTAVWYSQHPFASVAAVGHNQLNEPPFQPCAEHCRRRILHDIDARRKSRLRTRIRSRKMVLALAAIGGTQALGEHVAIETDKLSDIPSPP